MKMYQSQSSAACIAVSPCPVRGHCKTSWITIRLQHVWPAQTASAMWRAQRSGESSLRTDVPSANLHGIYQLERPNGDVSGDREYGRGGHRCHFWLLKGMVTETKSCVKISDISKWDLQQGGNSLICVALIVLQWRPWLLKHCGQSRSRYQLNSIQHPHGANAQTKDQCIVEDIIPHTYIRI